MGSAELDASRVCIRGPNWIGDVVMATPAFRAVREALPDAHVTLVIRRRVEPIVREAPWFDERVIYSPGRAWTPKEFFGCVALLRRNRYDLGLVLPNSFSSALMFRLAGVRRRVGYRRDRRSFLLTDVVPRPSEDGRFKPTYMVDYYLALCEQVGIAARCRGMELFFSDEDMTEAGRILEDQGISPDRELFLIHPGAGYGPAKRWPAERFARLAELLQGEHQAQVALIAGPAEASAVAAIQGASKAAIANLSSCGIDLHLLKCVVARSALLVTTDSGPRHYGVALGVPTVCVMGPTRPDYSTSALPHDRVVRVDVDCGPCQRRVCPLDHRCMEGVTAEMVFAECERALTTGSGTARDD